jgi:hypothetical protein
MARLWLLVSHCRYCLAREQAAALRGADARVNAKNRLRRKRSPLRQRPAGSIAAGGIGSRNGGTGISTCRDDFAGFRTIQVSPSPSTSEPVDNVSFESECDHWVKIRSAVGRKQAENNSDEARECAGEYGGGRVDQDRPSAIYGNERGRD